MSNGVLKPDSPGVALLQEAIAKLGIEVTDKTTVKELWLYHNQVIAYITERLLKEIKN